MTMTEVSAVACNLDQLFRYLDGLESRPRLADLQAAVARLPITCADVADFIRFADHSYQRNLVRAGPWFHLWVMCWKNGQRSPIHDHAASGCVVRVLRGTATETRLAFAPNGMAKAVSSRDLPAGSLCATQDADLHQISNLQSGGADLVTLHIYSPPLLRMATYSLTDARPGEDVWVEERKVITATPENSETPLASIRGWVTPNRLFFVRNHFPLPAIDLPAWRLHIEGRVAQPLALTWDELTALPERSVFATVECAGNGRSFLQEPAPGVQWGAGAVGHAEWTGVSVAQLLEEVGVQNDAVEVLFEGCDRGSEADHPEPMQFARSLPLAKALHPDTLLAYRMNGELLTASHGFPLRLFVPGWYGVASVKWLRRIELLDRPFQGYYQTTKYTYQRQGNGGLERVVVGPMRPKSEILRPHAGAVLGLGTNRLCGVAWAGEEAVAAVEISTDGGRTWQGADLIGSRAPYSWTLWEYLWEVARPGTYTLLARAVSESGQVQPSEHDPLWGGYLIHHSRPVRVQVGAARLAPARRADVEALLYDMNAYAEENARLPLDVEMAFSGGEGI
jgi:DMSO/TMAO reductase YedYZ molybdopterin-dependent catalytic subunit